MPAADLLGVAEAFDDDLAVRLEVRCRASRWLDEASDLRRRVREATHGTAAGVPAVTGVAVLQIAPEQGGWFVRHVGAWRTPSFGDVREAVETARAFAIDHRPARVEVLWSDGTVRATGELEVAA